MIKTLRASTLSFAFLTLVSLPFSEAHGGGDVQPRWVRQYISGFSPAFDMPFGMVVDASGNAHVTGGSYGPDQLPDVATIKYNSAGDTLWIRRFNGPGDNWDIGRAIAIDALGNVYVAGETNSESTHFDFITIKYTSSGAQEWAVRYDGASNSDDSPRAIAVDASGNVYVTGYSSTSATFYDYATIKYNSQGEQQWVARYNGPGNTKDQAAGLVLDAAGNVYVTGSSGEGSPNLSDYVTVKYSPSGVEEWVARYSDLYDYATAIGVDGSSNVYVTGYSYHAGTLYDYATVKYSERGVQQWVRRYNGPATDDDVPHALGVDASGNVVITGESVGPGTSTDYATIKYSPSGAEQWVRRYDGPGETVDVAFGLALDQAGNVYVTGGSRGADLVDDFATLKYSPSGVEQWSVRSETQGEVYDLGAAVGVDGSGDVYVTGSSSRLGGRLYTTIKYAEGSIVAVGNERGPGGGYRLEQYGPNPFHQKAVVRYALGARGHTVLNVFNVLGRRVATLVDGVRDAGYGTVEWDATGMPSGVYFFRLQAGPFVETTRMVLLR